MQIHVPLLSVLQNCVGVYCGAKAAQAENTKIT